ncbi:MAG: TlpA family protein disulfide reductase [Sedimenticola sp.]|nr:TlpA family protein disulfide reductase [Sedimenticola sp.]
MRCRNLFFLFLLISAASSAVEMVLPDLQGRDRSLSEFRGKWVLVNFWATWCSPCIEEMPELNYFHQRHQAGDAVVLGVNMEDLPLARLQRFVDKWSINYPVLLAPADGLTSLGRVSALPTSILISPQGEVVERKVGGITALWIEQRIRQADAAKRGKGE